MPDGRHVVDITGERWERLAHHSREVLMITALDGGLRYIDPSVRSILGYDPEEFAALASLDLVHPEDRRRARAAWRQAAEQVGGETTTTYRVRHRDGAWRWFEVVNTNLALDPVVDGIATYYHDITDRQHAEEALRASEERYRALVSHSYDAVVVTDAWMVASYVSPAMEAMFGYRPEELVGQSGLDHIHPDDLPDVFARAEHLFGAPGNRTVTQMRMRDRQGRWRWCECRSVNLLDHRAVRGVVHNFRDITDQHEAIAAVTASEEKLRALLQNADGGVLVTDDTGVILWASQPIERLFGTPTEELVGIRLVKRMHPDDRAEVIETFQKVLEGPDLMSRVEARVRHADGGYRWYEAVWTNGLDHPSVGGVVANIRDITERVLVDRALREGEARLEHQATHDHLTGLPNRVLLFRALEQARDAMAEAGGHFTLAFVDLDHFKWVNDSRGHHVGDELLVAVARRLQEAVRPGDVVARFGGDEFVVLCGGLSGERAAVAEARRLHAAVTGPYELRGSEVFVTVSVGVATAPAGVAVADDLVRDADSAMYEAKARGRDRLEVFDAGMRARAVRRLEVEGWLRRAVANRELRLHFQPIVDLTTGRIAGAEALVRWQHPTQGLLLPGAFIEVAEQSGLVLPIDRWVFAEAARMSAGWPTRYGGTEAVAVAVNLSARQFVEPRLAHQLAELVHQAGIPPGRIHVEITEGVVMEDPETSIGVLGALRELGVKVAVDDFGTGYSSLSYLRRLPLDILKVDRAFVRGLGRDDHDTAIVEAVVQLAHRLGLRVVAEGVETAGQLANLRRIGCDQAQGFYLARPMPLDAFHEVLVSDPVW
jgi:diguanylate cyclase (GGDEF)-like protein/PAS domain S-box-containing protein